MWEPGSEKQSTVLAVPSNNTAELIMDSLKQMIKIVRTESEIFFFSKPGFCNSALLSEKNVVESSISFLLNSTDGTDQAVTYCLWRATRIKIIGYIISFW